MGIGVSNEKVRLIFPYEVRNDVFKGIDDRYQAVGAEFFGMVDESVIDRDHLKAIKESLRAIVIRIKLIAISTGRTFEILLSDITEIG